MPTAIESNDKSACKSNENTFDQPAVPLNLNASMMKKLPLTILVAKPQENRLVTCELLLTRLPFLKKLPMKILLLHQLMRLMSGKMII